MNGAKTGGGVLGKGQWDHCRAAERATKVIEKFMHGTASDDETTEVSDWDRKQRAVFAGERPLYRRDNQACS